MTIEELLMDYWHIVSAGVVAFGTSIWWASRMTIKMSSIEIGISDIRQSLNELIDHPPK